MTIQKTLLCFPPAGSGSGLFRPWQHAGRERTAVVPASLPGRESRFKDPLPKSIAALADELAEELAPHACEPYAILGYSMGALLGYEVALRWQRWDLPSPEFLFVLGCNAPDRMVLDRDPFHTMNNDDFLQALRDLGGMPQEIIDNPDAMDVFEPVLRNDFRICETYRHSIESGQLACPAHIFVGESDEFIRWDAAAAWTEFLTGPITMHRLPGPHMIEQAEFSALQGTIETLWRESKRRQNAPFDQDVSGDSVET